MTALPRVAYLDHPGPIAMAHRGFSRDGLENSMAAFAAAVDLGYRYLETDVHSTSDGVLVAFHDHSLDRATDGSGRVCALPWSTVRRARIGGREPVPLLEDVLGTWPDVRVNVDVKAIGAIGPFVEVVRRTRAHDRVCIASFSDRRRGAVRRALGDRVASSLGARRVAAWRLGAELPAVAARAVVRAARDGAVAVQVPVRAGPLEVVTRRSVDRAHEAGLQVHVWTVDEAADIRRLLDLGVDGIITDRADTLRDVLRERGQWTG